MLSRRPKPATPAPAVKNWLLVSEERKEAFGVGFVAIDARLFGVMLLAWMLACCTCACEGVAAAALVRSDMTEIGQFHAINTSQEEIEGAMSKERGLQFTAVE